GVLLAVNGLALAVLLATMGALVAAAWPASNIDRALALLMTMTLRIGAWVGSLGAVCALAAALVIGVCRLTLRVQAFATLDRPCTRLVWAMVILLAVYMPLLTLGVAQRWTGAPPTTVVVTVKGVRSVGGQHGFLWFEVESWWRRDAVERIL